MKGVWRVCFLSKNQEVEKTVATEVILLRKVKKYGGWGEAPSSKNSHGKIRTLSSVLPLGKI